MFYGVIIDCIYGYIRERFLDQLWICGCDKLVDRKVVHYVERWTPTKKNSWLHAGYPM